MEIKIKQIGENGKYDRYEMSVNGREMQFNAPADLSPGELLNCASWEFNQIKNHFPKIIIKEVSCWNCFTSFDTNLAVFSDYGYVCPECLHSLERHPMFGQNREFDFANLKTRGLWGVLTTDQKKSQLKHYNLI